MPTHRRLVGYSDKIWLVVTSVSEAVWMSPPSGHRTWQVFRTYFGPPRTHILLTIGGVSVEAERDVGLRTTPPPQLVPARTGAQRAASTTGNLSVLTVQTSKLSSSVSIPMSSVPPAPGSGLDLMLTERWRLGVTASPYSLPQL